MRLIELEIRRLAGENPGGGQRSVTVGREIGAMFTRRMMLGAILGATFGAAALCAAGTRAGATPSARRLTEADAGRAVDLAVGDRLEIALPGNPTTGFQWEIGALDHAVVRPLGQPHFAPSSTAIGAGGVVTLRFEAVAPGTATVRLDYRRPFEKDVPPARTFSATATVK